jgi:hypothetical protein
MTKYLRKSTYKEERFSWAPGFKGFSIWSFGPVAFGPVARQYIMTGACGRGRSHLMEVRKLRGEDAQRRQCPNIPFNDTAP